MIYYIDPVNGNDANAGTSWGTAWKTITKSTTGTVNTTSDEFRIAKTAAAVSIGSCTWTDASPTVTFSSLSNVIVDQCESGWTAGLVTPTYQTTYVRQGTNALQAVMSSTNGKVCHKVLTTADYSGFTRITFWVNFGTAVNYTAGCPVSLRLCSDTGGTTAVNTLTLPSLYYPANYWVPITIDNGAALGSSIQSIALYTGSAVSNTIRLDNISVAKAESDATSIVLTDFVTKDTAVQCWYSVRSIESATTFNIIAPANQLATVPAVNYVHFDGTVSTTTLKRSPYPTTSLTAATATGTNVSLMLAPIDSTVTKTYSGGWNTGTNAVDGETWYDGVTGYGNGLTGAGTTFSNMTMCRYYVNNVIYASADGSTGTNHSLAGNNNAVQVTMMSGTAIPAALDASHTANFAFGTVSTGSATTTAGGAFLYADGVGFSSGSYSNAIPAITCQNLVFPSTGTSRGAFNLGGTCAVVDIKVTDTTYVWTAPLWYSTSSGINSVAGSYEFNDVHATTSLVQTPPCAVGSYTSGYCAPLCLKFNGRVINNAALVSGGGFGIGGAIVVDFGTTGKLMNNLSTGFIGNALYASNLQMTIINLRMDTGKTVLAGNGTPGGIALVNALGTTSTRYIGLYSRWTDSTPNYGWEYQTSVTHSGTGAWKHTNGYSAYPSYNLLPLGDVTLKGGVSATISLWGKCPATAKQFIVVKPGSDACSPQVATLMDQSDSWVKTSYTFTPDKNMVVKVFVVVQGCTTDGVVSYVDDLEVTQV